MSPSTLALSQRILARLMPPAQAEALLGDLLEERRLRLQAGSRSQRRRLVLEAARLVRASLAVGLGAARRMAHHCRHRRRQFHRRTRHSARAPVRAVADDDVEVYAGRHHVFSPSPPHWPPAGTSPRQSVSGRRDCSPSSCLPRHARCWRSARAPRSGTRGRFSSSVR